jgi:hypothetical protein
MPSLSCSGTCLSRAIHRKSEELDGPALDGPALEGPGLPASVYLAMKKGLPASVYFAIKTGVP